MGSVTGRQIVDKAAKILLDDGHVRWTDPEMLGWLNSAIVEIVLAKPDASAKNEAIALVAGTKQTLPAAGVNLFALTRNMGVSGASPGRAILQVSRKTLDATVPTWHQEAQAAEILCYTKDPEDPRTFYVFPPSTGTTKAEAVYSYLPAQMTVLTAAIPVDDIYENAVVDYLLYRAYSKETGQQNLNKASGYLTLFNSALGKKDSNEEAKQESSRGENGGNS